MTAATRNEAALFGWRFARFEEGWEWFRLNDAGQLDASSLRVFATVLECLEDATSNGYSCSAPAEAGRPNRALGD